VVRKE